MVSGSSRDYYAGGLIALIGARAIYERSECGIGSLAPLVDGPAES
jgi:hypothetical protein